MDESALILDARHGDLQAFNTLDSPDRSGRQLSGNQPPNLTL